MATWGASSESRALEGILTELKKQNQQRTTAAAVRDKALQELLGETNATLRQLTEELGRLRQAVEQAAEQAAEHAQSPQP